MAGATAVGALVPRSARGASDGRALAWTGFGAGFVILGIGLVGNSRVVAGIGALLIGGLSAFLTPQLTLAFYLVAGALKGAPWLAGVPDLTVITAGALGVAMLVQARKPGGIRPFPTATILAIGMVLLVVISVLWSPAPDIALERSFRFATFTMLAFFAPLVLIRTRGDLKRLMWLLVAASMLIALTSVPGPSPNQPRVIPGGSEIELALYSSIGLVAIAGYLLIVDSSRWRVLWLVPAVVLANTLVQAGSRGVLIASIAALFAIGVMAIARSRTKLVPIGVFSVAVIAAVVFAGQLSGPAATKYRGVVSGGGTVTLGKRNFLVRDGIDLALRYPLGRGVGGYEFETRFNWPHNIFVEAAAEEGVLGLALLVALILAAARSAFRAREGPLSPEAILALALLIVMVGDCMVSSTFTTFRPLWFAIGLALAVPMVGRRDETERA
jgi:O-antigen ligase